MKYIKIAVLLALVPSFALAGDGHHDDGHDDHDHGNASSRLQVMKGAKLCKAVSIRGTGEYLTPRSLGCLRSKRAAEAKGYLSALDGSFNHGPRHTATVLLSGGETVPPSNSAALADCTGVMNHNTLNFRLVCSHTIANFTAGHIHRGLPGQKGPMICASPNSENVLGFDCQLDAATHAALHAGELYVNLHSTDHPDGELRGQIIAE